MSGDRAALKQKLHDRMKALEEAELAAAARPHPLEPAPAGHN